MAIQSSQLIIQTAFLGDLILSIPLLKKIKENYPNDHLILVCKSGLGAYFLKEKIVDQVFEVKKNDRISYKNIISELNQLNIENLFCIHRSVRSQLMTFQIKAKRKIGFKSTLGYFVFNDLVSFKKTWPEALRQLQILTATDKKIKSQLDEKDWSFLNKPNGQGLLPQVPDLFLPKTVCLQNDRSSKKIALFPGSVWATKKWTEQGFATTANAFIDQGYSVFLMGGPDEKELCLSIQKNTPQSVVLAGTQSIVESIEFIKTCVLVIANDSAPTHMAAFQNIPVVSIFGPTTLDLGFRPWSSNAVIVENNNLNCRPCGKHGHQQCPLGHHHCMKHIAASTVIHAGLELLKTNSNSL